MSTSLGDLYIPIRAALGTFRQDVDKMATEAGKSAGDKFGDVFSAGFTSKALKAGGLITAGLAAGLTQLDTAARQYQATVGASAAETERAKTAALALFKVNTAGFDEILGLMAKLRTDQGLTEEQTNRLAQSYLTWAKVAGGTATDAAKNFDGVLDAWNLTATDAAGIMDQLVASNQKYGGSLQQRVSDLATLAPALKGLGLDIGDAIALENAFEVAGLDAGAAQRALTSAIAKLKPGQTFSDLTAQISAIEDPTLRAQKAIELFGARGAGLANVFKPGADSLDAFGVSAEVSAGKLTAAGQAIDSSIPKQFELAIKNISGTLLELAAPAGPALLAAASVAQLAGALGGPLLGAVRAVIPVMLALSAAETAVTTSSTAASIAVGAPGGPGLLGRLGLLVVALGAVAVASSQSKDQVDGYKEQIKDMTAFTVRGGKETTAFSGTLGAQTPIVDTLRSAIKGLLGIVANYTPATKTAAAVTKVAGGEVSYLGKTAAVTALHLDRTKLSTLGVATATSTLTGQLKSAYGITISEGDAALFLARGMDAAAIAAQRAAAAVAAFKAGHPVNLSLPRGSADTFVGNNVGSVNTTDAAFDPAALAAHNAANPFVPPKVPRGGGGGGGSGASTAATQAIKDQAKAANDLADTLKGKLSDALGRVRDATLDYFSKAHTANLQAITDERKHTQDAIDGARARIAAHLDEVRATANAPVTDAEKSQQAIEDARRLRDLQESLASAQAGTTDAQGVNTVDARAVRSATEALQSYQAAAAIAGLRATANATIAQATQDAAAEEAALKAQEAAADAKAKAATVAEDARYATQQKNFKRSFDALVANYENEKTTHAQKQGEIIALLNTYGLEYQKAGALLGKSFNAGLEDAIGDAEDIAEKFAKAIAKYLKLKSPAEAGPLSEPAGLWGGKLITDWLAGATAAARAAAHDMTGIADALAAPMAYAAASPSAAYARGTTGAGQAARDGNPPAGPTINVYNPAPEPAGRSVVDVLKLRSAFGN